MPYDENGIYSPEVPAVAPPDLNSPERLRIDVDNALEKSGDAQTASLEAGQQGAIAAERASAAESKAAEARGLATEAGTLASAAHEKSLEAKQAALNAQAAAAQAQESLASAAQHFVSNFQVITPRVAQTILITGLDDGGVRAVKLEYKCVTAYNAYQVGDIVNNFDNTVQENLILRDENVLTNITSIFSENNDGFGAGSYSVPDSTFAKWHARVIMERLPNG